MNAKYALLLGFMVAYSNAAPAEDLVSSLPGWNGDLPSDMYSGFIDVGPNKTHHIHYVLVESMSPTAATDPLVLWVQGGPGGSSMEGWLTENMGPLQLADVSLSLAEALGSEVPVLIPSPHPWNSVANMLFWEAPAGVGFSYCDRGSDDDAGVAGCPHWNDTTSAVEQAEFVCEWFASFPEYADNPFFMVGESYAGVYIPTTGLELLQSKCVGIGPFDGGSREQGGKELNFQGIAVGNGCTGTDAGPCSGTRSFNTYLELAAQGMVSTATQQNVSEACEDSNGFTSADEACQAAVLEASDEAGPFYNYNVHDVCDDRGTTTLAHFLCSETVPTPVWACAHTSNKVKSEGDEEGEEEEEEVVNPELPRFEGSRRHLYYPARQTQGSKQQQQQQHHPPPPPQLLQMHQQQQHLFQRRGEGSESSQGVKWSQVIVEDSSLGFFAETYYCDTQDAMAAWLSSPAVMAALHVERSGLSSWPGPGIAYDRTAPNLLVSPGYPDFLEAGLQVLIFSGDFDGQVPHFGTEQWTAQVASDAGLTPTAPAFRPWYVASSSGGGGGAQERRSGGNEAPPLLRRASFSSSPGHVAGRFTTYNASGEFTYATVARAGHMAPHYKPREALELLTRFVQGGANY